MKVHSAFSPSGYFRNLLKVGILSSLGFLLTTHVEGEAVDTELLLLVDVSRPGLSTTQFNESMNAYAAAFTSTEVINSIQSGAYGKIALSMMFYGNAATQEVAIPWMAISNAAEAAQFATLVTSVARPFSFGFASPAAALTAATPLFGTETGGPDNGFESTVQSLEMAASGITLPIGGTAAATTAARDATLASGVDVINSVATGNFGTIFEAFYETNVIGSEIEGVEATSESAGSSTDFASTIASGLNQTVQAGAVVSVNTIPEPSATFLFSIASGLLLLRRRRS